MDFSRRTVFRGLHPADDLVLPSHAAHGLQPGERFLSNLYMDYKPVMLAKFYDIKSLLFKEILENEDYYKVASILPNPGNDNKIVKCVNILDNKYMAGR